MNGVTGTSRRKRKGCSLKAEQGKHCFSLQFLGNFRNVSITTHTLWMIVQEWTFHFAVCMQGFTFYYPAGCAKIIVFFFLFSLLLKDFFIVKSKMYRNEVVLFFQLNYTIAYKCIHFGVNQRFIIKRGFFNCICQPILCTVIFYF